MGDVDGDGELDFFVTAARHDEPGFCAGKCYLVAGGTPVRNYGTGVAGTGGVMPAIATPDCPNLGAVVTIEVTSGRGAAPGVLVYGAAPASLPLGAGLLLAQPDVVVPHTLGGSPGSPGAGSFQLAVPIGLEPASFGTSLWFQAAYLDPEAVGGIALTSGLKVTRIQLP